MKIVIVGPVFPFRGGIAHYTTLLVKNLQLAGHSVKVISFRRQYPAWLYPGTTDRDTSKEQIRVPAEYLLDPLYPWTWFQAAQRILKENPDAVIIQYWTTFWALPFAALTWLFGKGRPKLAYLVHNVMPHESKPWDRVLSRLALRAADKYIVQAEKEADRLRTLIPTAQIVRVTHPVYKLFSDQTIEPDQARSRLGLQANDRVLLFFGIVRPYKGLRYLLEAVSLIQAQAKNVHVLVAGEFWEPEQAYRSLVEELGIGGQTHFHNYYVPNEEVPVFFRAADVFVAPYTDGTQSGAVKMAMGFGLPIVLTDCILDETIIDQANIWRANPRDPESLAQSILRALEGTVSMTAVPASDGWERVVKAIEAL